MSNYRRPRRPGGTFFFTVVTHQRRRMLTVSKARDLLREAMENTREARPFETVAMVLLPDHLHAIWRLPRGDGDFTTRWKLIKTRFTRAMVRRGWVTGHISNSRLRRQERDIWQRRFWDHFIRDENDLRRHIDYVHWNPVKHGLVKRVRDWPHSTFHRCVHQGLYPADWGCWEPPTIVGLDVDGE